MEITTCDIVEMLKTAIAGERNAANYYLKLAEAVPSNTARQEILTIRRQELRHYDLLQEIYADITGRDYMAAEPPQGGPKGWCEGVKEAICRELKDAEAYSSLACCLLCMRHKEKVLDILNDEKCHAKILYKFYEDCK